MMARVPLWELRRLALRAKRLIERRRSEAPVVAAHETTVTSAADRFLTAYDKAVRIRGAWKRAVQTGHVTGDAEYQQSLAEVRHEAQAFHTALSAYRRALVALLDRGDQGTRRATFEDEQESQGDAGAP
jgi:hypothetical protein